MCAKIYVRYACMQCMQQRFEFISSEEKAVRESTGARRALASRSSLYSLLRSLLRAPEPSLSAAADGPAFGHAEKTRAPGSACCAAYEGTRGVESCT